jgi:hypothetical protein
MAPSPDEGLPRDGGGGDGPVVELTPLVAPVSSAPWSDEFVAQTLEVFIVALAPSGLRHFRPIHAGSLRLGMAVRSSPGDLVVSAVERYGLAAIVAHSTSWRSEPGRVILTYVAAVATPDALSPYLADEPVGRTDLARGQATAAPTAIAESQVLEHALRHLSWLVRDDPAVGTALAAWGPALEAYVPEPFQNL